MFKELLVGVTTIVVEFPFSFATSFFAFFKMLAMSFLEIARFLSFSNVLMENIKELLAKIEGQPIVVQQVLPLPLYLLYTRYIK